MTNLVFRRARCKLVGRNSWIAAKVLFSCNLHHFQSEQLSVNVERRKGATLPFLVNHWRTKYWEGCSVITWESWKISSWDLFLPLFGSAFLQSHRHGWEEIIWPDQRPEKVSATVSSSWLDKEVFGWCRRNDSMLLAGEHWTLLSLKILHCLVWQSCLWVFVVCFH